MDHRLRKNNQFNYIYKKGERFNTENFSLFVVKSRYENYKVGISVSKKLGKANKRNLLKRRVREIVRTSLIIPSFCNFVLLAKENAVNLSFDELKNDLQKLFKKYENKSENKNSKNDNCEKTNK